jgi:hypothetical protein
MWCSHSVGTVQRGCIQTQGILSCHWPCHHHKHPYVKDISGTGLDGHSTGAASSDTKSFRMHTFFALACGWLFTYVLGHCQILGSKTFKQKAGSQRSTIGGRNETHTPPFWRHINSRPPAAKSAGSITGQQLTHDLYVVHSSTGTAGCTLFTAILSGDTIHYPNRGEADPGGRAVLGVGMRPLACRDCGFESRQRNGWILRVLRAVR